MPSRKDNKGRVLRPRECQRKDGLYMYQYNDMYGKRRVIYATDLLKLREREKEVLRNLEDNIDSYLGEKMTLNAAYERYMSGKINLKHSTKVNYNYMYDLVIRDTLGKRKVNKICFSELKAFYSSFLASGRFKMRSIEIIHTLLHPTFDMLVRDGIIRKNPSDGIIAELKQSIEWERKSRHALTIEQQTAFMKYVRDSPIFYHWFPIFVFFLGTGCRVGEVTGLCWEDVDFEERILTIQRTLIYRPEEDRTSTFHVSKPKTKAGIRQIPMEDEVYRILREEYEYQKTEGFSKQTIDGQSGFVFRNRYGTVLNPASINRAIQRICNYYNEAETEAAQAENRKPLILPKFSCHVLRHTFCTRYCEVESNIKVIQDIMGHADISTTMDIYAEVTNSKKQESLLKRQDNILIL